jgi:hypothetical protein
MKENVLKYRQYTEWLGSLPLADVVDNYRSPGTVCDQAVFVINGKKFLQGITGDENEESVIAVIRQGNLLKARVFQPFKGD